MKSEKRKMKNEEKKTNVLARSASYFSLFVFHFAFVTQ